MTVLNVPKVTQYGKKQMIINQWVIISHFNMQDVLKEGTLQLFCRVCMIESSGYKIQEDTVSFLPWVIYVCGHAIPATLPKLHTHMSTPSL